MTIFENLPDGYNEPTCRDLEPRLKNTLTTGTWKGDNLIIHYYDEQRDYIVARKYIAEVHIGETTIENQLILEKAVLEEVYPWEILRKIGIRNAVCRVGNDVYALKPSNHGFAWVATRKIEDIELITIVSSVLP